MGDALSTWVETEAACKTRAANLAGGRPTMAAVALARLCFDTLMEHGSKPNATWKQGPHAGRGESHRGQRAASGLGFESGGLATAHMVANNLPSNVPRVQTVHARREGRLRNHHPTLPGRRDRRAAENTIVDFEIAAGLPVTFADINLEGGSRAARRRSARHARAKGSLSHNHPFTVTADDVVDAMIAADALGCERKRLRLAVDAQHDEIYNVRW